MRIRMGMVFWVIGVAAAPAASLTNAVHWAPIPGGNAADTNAAACPTNCGAVAYDYAIMKCEVTATQYNEYAGSYTNGLADEPARFVTFSNAMAYADWLTTNTPLVFTTSVTCAESSNNVVRAVIFTNYYAAGIYAAAGYRLTDLPGHEVLSNVAAYRDGDAPPGTNWYQAQFGTNCSFTLNPSDQWITWDHWSKASSNFAYALPTENEWYKAAYGVAVDPDRYGVYPKTDSAMPDTNEFNFGESSNRISAVGSRTGVSSYGTYDQGGNVWEWIEPNTNPPVIPPGMAIIRGGSYFSHDSRDLGVWTREYHAATNAVAGIGFRLIRIPRP